MGLDLFFSVKFLCTMVHLLCRAKSLMDFRRVKIHISRPPTEITAYQREVEGINGHYISLMNRLLTLCF